MAKGSIRSWDLVAVRVGVVLSCCVEFVLALAVTEVGSSRFLCSKLGLSWAIGLIPCLTIVYSGGGSNLQLTSPNDGIIGCVLLLVLPVRRCVFQGLRSPFSPVCSWQLRPHSALASPWVLHCFARARL
ncbi:hypothetical protein F2Q69_00020347 [Brassica cretica]|uniref:Uncharacterized protein n=1 Tax=Brassica cretica TaxID=69181 RepID=A0A8S9QD75_BRACR|nr:hypothetical protein F2Q69_00020347 [Brassica cretica]